MPIQENQSIFFYTFDTLNLPGIKHAVFTRKNGVSPPPWASLNFGATVGDSQTRVSENYRRAFRALDCDLESMYDAWQIHGTKVVFVEKPRLNAPHEKADILITNRPEITLFMRFADCVPILLYDPQKSVIGLIHAGWLGTLHRIARIAVQAMVDQYGSDPSNILAAIGPSIGPDVYEIGPEVVSMAKETFNSSKEHIDNILRTRNGSIYLDLWFSNQLILSQSGVRKIEISGICTASNVTDWYSHRAENGKTGRFGVLLALT